jgi:hypothetical protein
MGIEAAASAQLCSQAGAWEQEAKDLHPNWMPLPKTKTGYHREGTAAP